MQIPEKGFDKAREVLEQGLPPVCLIYGVSSKVWDLWNFSRHLFSYHGIVPTDRFPMPYLSVDRIVTLKHFLTLKPDGAWLGVVANIDPGNYGDLQHNYHLNSLLKVLEDSPHAKFILLATEPSIPAVESRAEIYRVGLVAGQTSEQEQLAKTMKDSVESVLWALETKDRELFDNAMRRWSVPAEGVAGLRMLRKWMYDSLTSESGYNPALAPRLVSNPGIVKSMLIDLDTFSSAPPKIAVQAALYKYI